MKAGKARYLSGGVKVFQDALYLLLSSSLVGVIFPVPALNSLLDVPGPFARQKIECMGQAHLLHGMKCRVIGIGFECMVWAGPFTRQLIEQMGQSPFTPEPRSKYDQ